MAPKPLVFVPGLPGSKLIDNQAGGQELFPSLAALTSTTLRPKLLRCLSGPDDPDQDDGMVAGEPIRSVLFRSSLIDFSGSRCPSSSDRSASARSTPPRPRRSSPTPGQPSTCCPPTRNRPRCMTARET